LVFSKSIFFEFLVDSQKIFFVSNLNLKFEENWKETQLYFPKTFPAFFSQVKTVFQTRQSFGRSEPQIFIFYLIVGRNCGSNPPKLWQI
jgi:hypothetical protein